MEYLFNSKQGYRFLDHQYSLPYSCLVKELTILGFLKYGSKYTVLYFVISKLHAIPIITQKWMA